MADVFLAKNNWHVSDYPCSHMKADFEQNDYKMMTHLGQFLVFADHTLNEMMSHLVGFILLAKYCILISTAGKQRPKSKQRKNS